MKHAIIVTGGKQYRVAEGDVIFVEKLDAAAGESVKFDQVLAVIDGENATFGAPVVEGASVTANVVKSGKGAKVRVYKSEQSVVLTLTDIGAGMDLGSALSDKDIAGENKLTVGSLGAKTLRLTVAAVLGRTHTFFMCHLGYTSISH